MKTKRTFAALDLFRLAAALLVITIHTSPLASFSPEADFWLTRVFARLAVPFFFMTTGYFLSRDRWNRIGAFLKKTAFLYAAAALLYLPLNFMNSGYTLTQWLRRIFFEGTFYHLWYFPALLLGVCIAKQLSRAAPKTGLLIAGLLYLIGLFGDSYYGAAALIPACKNFYQLLFALIGYTRSGFFFAPLFLLLGANCRRLSIKKPLLLFISSLLGMSVEAFLLHSLGWQRHDSMYLFLPVCTLSLFYVLLSCNQGRSQTARRVSILVYLLHPWCIVLVRGGAKLLNAEAFFIQNSLGHFLSVCFLSFGIAFFLSKINFRKPSSTARAWREIDADALCHNAGILKEAAGCELMAVVKADAYGHGAVPAARILQKHGVHFFAVACLAEGIRLRKAGIRGEILILGHTSPQEASVLHRWRLSQAISGVSYARALAAQGVPVRVHIALDTGMHRLGVPADDMQAVLEICRLPSLKLSGTFSHLCVADSAVPAHTAYTALQLQRFYTAIAHMRAAGFNPAQTHIQASYGILNLPPQPCSLARAGIALYGLSSDGKPFLRQNSLRPVLSLYARVALVRTLSAGESAGYGLMFTAARLTRLAVITIGYADGLPRDFAARGGQVLINGRKAPVVGLLCMDQLFADVTAIETVKCGDIVTVIGHSGEAELSAEAVAVQCGTITNELLTRLSARLPVIFTPKGDSAFLESRP